MGKTKQRKHFWTRGRDLVKYLPKFIVLETHEDRISLADGLGYRERRLCNPFQPMHRDPGIFRNYNQNTKRIEVYDVQARQWFVSRIVASGGNTFLYVN